MGFPEGGRLAFSGKAGYLADKRGGKSADTPAAPWASPPVISVHHQVSAPVRMAVPTGATHFLVTEVTDNEGHDDSGQHVGRDVK